MSFIQENILEINIGLNKEYKIIHISDVHAVTSCDNDSDDVKEEALKVEDLWYRQRTWFADKFGEYYDESHMIPSKEAFEKLIDYINNENPNVSILSGDIIDYYSESNFKMLEEECDKIKVPYLFLIGNHEAPTERFKSLTKSDIGFSKIDLGEFKIVSIDNSTKSVSPATLNSFKEELDDNKPIIVAMHIPVSTSYNKDEMNKLDQYFIINHDDTDSTTKEFIDILISNPNIKGVLCGHLHGFSYTHYANDKPQISASSGLIGWVNKIIVK